MTPKVWESQYTPLLLAAHCNRVEMVSLLINHPNMTKSGINQGDITGNTPLMYAIEAHKKIFQMLIKNDKIDVNIKNGEGNTVLHVSAKCCHIG